MFIPAPDPAPNTGNHPIVIATTRQILPAVNKLTGERIPGWSFDCTYPARWHGHVNLAGHRRCVLFKR